MLFVPVGAVVAPVVGGVVFGTLQSKDGIRVDYVRSTAIGALFGVTVLLFAVGLFIATPVLSHAATTVQSVAFGFLAELHPLAYALVAGTVATGAFVGSSLLVAELELGRRGPPSPTSS